jgi:hypothetical protein
LEAAGVHNLSGSAFATATQRSSRENGFALDLDLGSGIDQG